MAANEIRIIGGKWKRRKLRFLPTPDLRPTLGRVRETLANWLRPEIQGATCLDLFAGSGSLGLEALSQGAASVTFVERNRRQAQQLTASLDELGVDSVQAQVKVLAADAFLKLAHHAEKPPWDIIFLDPPFSSPWLEISLATLRLHPRVQPSTFVYVECQKHHPFEFEGWQQVKQGTAGDTRFGLLATSRQPS